MYERARGCVWVWGSEQAVRPFEGNELGRVQGRAAQRSCVYKKGPENLMGRRGKLEKRIADVAGWAHHAGQWAGRRAEWPVASTSPPLGSG